MENETNELTDLTDQVESQVGGKKAKKGLLKKYPEGEVLSPAKKPFVTKKKVIIIFLVVLIVAAVVFSYIQTLTINKNLDKRPFAEEFRTEKTLPNNPNVTRNSEGEIILDPVKSNELIFAENKLEQRLEKDLDSVGFTEQVSQIKSITRYKTVDENFDKQSDIIEVVVSNPQGENFAIQYLDEYDKDKKVDPIDYTNETKTLTSLTKQLKDLPVYDVTPVSETGISYGYSFIKRNQNEVDRYIRYSEDFSSADVYSETDEGDFEKVETLQPDEKLMSAYKKSIEEIGKIAEAEYDAIMAGYNQKNYDKDYTFKE